MHKACLLVFFAVAVPLFPALADYDLFSSGYPPAQTFSSATGAASMVALGVQVPKPSTPYIALDSRFRTFGFSNTHGLCSLPPGFCITLR